MTDRLKGLWVSFKEPMRTDDAEPIMNAISLLENVADVVGNIQDSDDWLNRSSIKRELINKLWDVLK